jgi:solute carrier family 41
MSGLALERYLEFYPGIAFVAPVMNGIAGNLGAVYASRITTAFHSDTTENHRQAIQSLLLANLPIQTAFLVVMKFLRAGHIQLTPLFVFCYLIASFVVVRLKYSYPNLETIESSNKLIN